MNLPNLWRHREEPFRTLSRLQRDFDRFFETFPESQWTQGQLSPSCEMSENEKEYCLKFDLPGIKKDDVKIEVDGSRLSVSAERREEKEAKEKNGRHYSEINYGSYSRSFTLPSTVDDKKVDATFENGVLTVRLPKNESTRAKQIPVK